MHELLLRCTLSHKEGSFLSICCVDLCWEGQFNTEFLAEETGIIDETSTLLDVDGYFNIDAELA